MNKLSRQQRRQLALQRFDTIDWQLPLSPEAMVAVYEHLPKRYADEELVAWLRRTKHNLTQRFRPTTTIVRRAAASGSASDAVLYTQDESLRLTIQLRAQHIAVTVEALGFDIERYAYRTIGISSRRGINDFIAVITLNAEGEGHATFEAENVVRQLFLDPSISPIIGIVD